MILNEIAKQYTRVEFLKMTQHEKAIILDGDNCPCLYGLKTLDCNNEDFQINECNCGMCWSSAVTDIWFTGDIDKNSFPLLIKCTENEDDDDITVGKYYIAIKETNCSNSKRFLLHADDTNDTTNYYQYKFQIIGSLIDKYYDLKQELNSIQNAYNYKQNQWENEQVEKVKELEDRIDKYQDSILEKQDKISEQKQIIEDFDEEIHNLDLIIQDLQKEKKSLKIELELANNKSKSVEKFNEQLKEIIKQFSDML